MQSRIFEPDPPKTVRISSATLRQRFNGCDPEYIRTVCHGACCRSSVAPSGILVVVHPAEQVVVEQAGGVVKDGKLCAVERRCPFQESSTDLCSLHGTPAKPFGCIASPFTLSPSGRSLVIRNRYRLLKCYNDGRKLPAYVAFRGSLDAILGTVEANSLCALMEDGLEGHAEVPIPERSWRWLRQNDESKRRA